MERLFIGFLRINLSVFTCALNPAVIVTNPQFEPVISFLISAMVFFLPSLSQASNSGRRKYNFLPRLIKGILFLEVKPYKVCLARFKNALACSMFNSLGLAML